MAEQPALNQINPQERFSDKPSPCGKTNRDGLGYLKYNTTVYLTSPLVSTNHV